MAVEIFRRLLNRLKPESTADIATVSPAPVEIIPSAPKPEIINLEKHTLRFYPGFKEFADLWRSFKKISTLEVE